MHLFLSVMLVLALGSAAQAGNQLFEGSWSVKAFGNECAASKVGTTGGTAMLDKYPHCDAARSGESEFYSAFGLPQGIQCNPLQPRCPFSSTPTSGGYWGRFDPRGGVVSPTLPTQINCTPYSVFGGATMRPAKGATITVRGRPVPPLYRNPGFFTPYGQPNHDACDGRSTGYTTQHRTRFGANKGLVQQGNPVAGSWSADVSGPGGFAIDAAPKALGGIRVTGVIGSFGGTDQFFYRYTYATLRNGAGFFGPGKGPGSFNLLKKQGANTVASINVKQGAAKFGGTMRMLGALTSKVADFVYLMGNGYFSELGENNWRYDAIGTSALTVSGVVTNGYVATYRAHYITSGGGMTRIVVEGSRFPWTTGSVTVTAVGRGPHKTVHYAHGYDNRTPTSGKGTIQLVSPTLTRWLRPPVYFETAGIGILKIKFVPEPQMWATLVAGVALLSVGYRMRGR